MCNVPKNNVVPNEQHLINNFQFLILEYGYPRLNQFQIMKSQTCAIFKKLKTMEKQHFFKCAQNFSLKGIKLQ